MIKSGGDQTMLALFTLDEQRYALPLETVDRVIRAVEVVPVPETPPFILGLINLGGQILSVISLRACLGLPDHAIRLADQFIISHTPRLSVALVVDEVLGLTAAGIGQTVSAEDALARGEYRVHGMVKIEGDIVLIYDLDKVLSPDDQDLILQATAQEEA